MIAIPLCFILNGISAAQQNNTFATTDDDNVIRDNFFAEADYQQPDYNAPEPVLNALSEVEAAIPGELPVNPPAWLQDIKSQAATLDLPKVFGSLALVLGGYFVFVWLSRQLSGGYGDGGLPQEVVEVLGQTPFGAKKNLQLVRLGSKLLLLINSPEGTQSIGEITDPHEVEYLIGVCGGKRPSRNNIASRKPAGSIPNTNPANELKRILTQLQQPAGGIKTSSVFEA